MASKGSSKGKKARYDVYKNTNRVAKNKERKLERHLKRHPDDEQAKNAKSGTSRSIKPTKPMYLGKMTRLYAQQVARANKVIKAAMKTVSGRADIQSSISTELLEQLRSVFPKQKRQRRKSRNTN